MPSPKYLGHLFGLVFIGLVGCSSPADESSFAAESAWGIDPGDTYGERAQHEVSRRFDTMIHALSNFHQGTLPHEAKDLRTQVGEVSDMLEIFAYAYPGSDWVKYRDLVKQGYSSVGAFKDLADAQLDGQDVAVRGPDGQYGPGVPPEDLHYDPTTLQKRRDAVLNWLAEVRDPKKFKKLEDYVKSPDKSKIYDRSNKELSDLYWGATKAEPSAKKTALQNLSKLGQRLFDAAAEDLAKVDKVTDLTKTSDHEQFHDMRKRVRAVLKLFTYFPELAPSGSKGSIDLLTEFVDRYGVLNDLFIRYDLTKSAKTDRAKAEAKALAVQLAERWKALKAWQDQQKIAKVIDNLDTQMKKRAP